MEQGVFCTSINFGYLKHFLELRYLTSTRIFSPIWKIIVIYKPAFICADFYKGTNLCVTA